MLKRSAKLVALYLAGIVLVGGWSLHHVLGGSATSENLAQVIVFPLAWIFGFWPTVGPLFVAYKIWRLQHVLQELADRKAAGVTTEAQEQELEDTFTLMVVEENPIPERFARKLVRRALAAAKRRAEADPLQPGSPLQAGPGAEER